MFTSSMDKAKGIEMLTKSIDTVKVIETIIPFSRDLSLMDFISNICRLKLLSSVVTLKLR